MKVKVKDTLTNRTLTWENVISIEGDSTSFTLYRKFSEPVMPRSRYYITSVQEDE